MFTVDLGKFCVGERVEIINGICIMCSQEEKAAAGEDDVILGGRCAAQYTVPLIYMITADSIREHTGVPGSGKALSEVGGTATHHHS